ncbi:hypothetical protein ACIQTU_01905 [Brevundimonas sp. NPDC090276]|uniref:hypothetical protein n=1 Tax=Brevundimonas sp. NPDC090276 TaxID=3363956 RepID=UPI00383B29FD
MIESAAHAEGLAWSSSPFEYGLMLLLAALLAGVISFLAPLAPASFAFAFVGPSVIAGYGVLGLVRPRQVSLQSECMVIRPVLGKERRFERADIVEVREVMTPPLGSLIARVRDQKGRTKGVVVQNRLVLADVSVRHGGRTVGIISSVRGRRLAEWVGGDCPGSSA